MQKTVIARWESARGKYWLEMYREYADGLAPSYSYRGDSGGGFIGSRDIEPDGLAATDAKVIDTFARDRLADNFPSSFVRKV